MKKFITLLILILLLFGCGNQIKTLKGELPPGWKLACSVDGGKYTLIDIDGYRWVTTVWSTKFMVISQAWYSYESDENAEQDALAEQAERKYDEMKDEGKRRYK